MTFKEILVNVLVMVIGAGPLIIDTLFSDFYNKRKKLLMSFVLIMAIVFVFLNIGISEEAKKDTERKTEREVLRDAEIKQGIDEVLIIVMTNAKKDGIPVFKLLDSATSAQVYQQAWGEKGKKKEQKNTEGVEPRQDLPNFSPLPSSPTFDFGSSFLGPCDTPDCKEYQEKIKKYQENQANGPVVKSRGE